MGRVAMAQWYSHFRQSWSCFMTGAGHTYGHRHLGSACFGSRVAAPDRGENNHEGDRGDGSGRGNGRGVAGGTARAPPSPATDRPGPDRPPSIPGQELAGVVTALGYGTTGLSVGPRVFGLTDSYRGGGLAGGVGVAGRT